MSGAIDVSVLVPCYNTQRYLDQALTSAEQNGRCNLEIIVLNDGSTDDSLQIMRTHERRDARVRVVDKHNEGYGATLNRGIREARGTYVAILEPDDYVLPHAYDELMDVARAMDAPDVVKAGYWRIMCGDDAARPSYGYLRGRVRTKGRCFSLVDEPALIQYHPSIWAALYRRSFLEEEGVRFLEVPGAGWVDNPFTVDALGAAKRIAYTDEAYYCYREDLAEASSANVSAGLMVARWMDRQDALESRGIRDRGVQGANAVVGLRFLARILDDAPSLDQTTREAARAMAQRIDASLFAEIDCISPHVMRRVLEFAGTSAPIPAECVYYAHLLREARWALCHNGVRFFAHNLMVARGQ